MASISSNDNDTTKKYSFQAINLSPGVLSYVEAQKFARMTPVQAATIPLLLRQDVAVQAVTGSGKTLSFLIPILEHLQKTTAASNKRKKTQIHSLILSPTRELAQQTCAVAKDLCLACSRAPPLLLTGGSSQSSSSTRPVTIDLKTFSQQGNDILIGTPGRVQDFLSYDRVVVDCSELEYLILDEADVLFHNMALCNTLSNILERLPKQKRVGLFSATTSTSKSSGSLQEWVVRVGMRNPVWVDVAVVAVAAQQQEQPTATTQQTKRQQRTPLSLSNYYLTTRIDEKLSRLFAFLQDHADEKIIIFFLTCACVEFFGAALQQLLLQRQPGVGEVNQQQSRLELLHGKLVQKRREKTLERFNQNPNGILACTDVAARGLDVVGVDWVLQLDAPQDPAVFVHRVGRTARAGRLGQSLLFLTPKEEAYIELLHMRQVPITPFPPASSERCCPPESSAEQEADSANNKPKGTKRLLRSAVSEEPLTDVLPLIRELVLKDRDLLEKGTKAFTSYIRAYKEHQCAFIFRFQSLDLGLLATSFALLRLPKMPELRDRLVLIQKTKHSKKKSKKDAAHADDDFRNLPRLPRFEPAGPDVDIFAIPYLDPQRDAARKKRLQATAGREQQFSANNNHHHHDNKQVSSRQGPRQATAAFAAKGLSKPDKPEDDKKKKKRGRNAKLVEEWDDLAKEERLYKKLRQKKITQEQYDNELYGDGGDSK